MSKKLEEFKENKIKEIQNQLENDLLKIRKNPYRRKKLLRKKRCLSEKPIGKHNILTKKEMDFCKYVVEGKSLVEAFKLAFPQHRFSQWAGKYASLLAKDPKIKEQIELLQQAMRAQFIINAPRALDRLEELAEKARNEKVKLDANIEILDRAGMGPPQKVELLHLGIFGNLSAEDVRNLIKKNIDHLESARDKEISFLDEVLNENQDIKEIN